MSAAGAGGAVATAAFNFFSACLFYIFTFAGEAFDFSGISLEQLKLGFAIFAFVFIDFHDDTL